MTDLLPSDSPLNNVCRLCGVDFAVTGVAKDIQPLDPDEQREPGYGIYWCVDTEGCLDRMVAPLAHILNEFAETSGRAPAPEGGHDVDS